MPPKQKMGSITHNSAEVNRGLGRGKGGMLSKIKGSFASVSSKNVNNRSELTKSCQNTQGTNPHVKVKRRGFESFTHGDSTVLTEEFSTAHSRGVPTSITALVDAASVLSDEFDDPNHNRYRQDFRPQSVQRRGSVNYGNPTGGSINYGTNDAASRALVNLNLGGAPMDQGMPQRNNSQERNNAAEWGRPPQQPMVQVNNNAGYNNYSYDGYDGYDGYEDEGDGGDYYDESGGGIFDDSYMRTSKISVSAHQPPPPDRGYNRRSTNEEFRRSSNTEEFRRSSNAEEFRRSSNVEEFRRSSNADEFTPDPYSRRSSNGEESYSRRSSNGEEFTPDQYSDPYYRRSSNESYPTAPLNNTMQPYRGPSDGETDPRMSYGNPPPPDPKRNSIDNANNSPGRRATTDYDPRKSSNERRRATTEYDPRKSPNERHNSSGHNSGHTNNTVTNTGRGAGSSHSSSKSSNMKMSASGKHNPSWFTGQHSDSTEPVQNNIAHKDNLRSSSRHYQNEQDEDDRTMTTMTTMATKEQALRPSAMIKAKDLTSPHGDVTIVFTDVQGSTTFWETCPTDMKKATDMHDIIIRQCYTNHSGYEITTEGDSFNLAFQHPVDALAFALQAQLKLYKADWPSGILNHRDGKDEPALKFRGFRVRFGIHHGPTTSRVHEMTGRTLYSGEAVKIAKQVEGMCHGGQILTTMETWKAVSGMAERYLGRPQILDCGEHLLFEIKNPNPGTNGYTTTRYTRRIMQLVPSDLSFDFFEARGRRDVLAEDGKTGFEIKDASSINGRLFPPLTSKRQLTTCFLNAPYANGRVTICFVYTVGLDENPDNKAQNLGVLAKYVRKQMLVLNPPGYECQEDNGCWMLSFDRMAHAVTFGLQLKSTLLGAEDLVGTVDYENMFKVGILSGPFTSMGPHKTTGMADYFGPIVNRAARVASNCEAGQICVGIPLSNGVTADPPDFGPTVNVGLQGIKKLKGITIDMAIFACSKRRIETPYR